MPRLLRGRAAGLVSLCTAVLASPAHAAGPAIEHAAFGKVAGKPVQVYTLKNDKGVVLKVLDYGAVITELHLPDRSGKLADVVLGYDKLEDYLNDHSHFGGVVGRVANRVRNARFSLDGREYKLAPNDPPHHLHGGNRGWDRVLWRARPRSTPDGPALELTHTSPDGEEGYPGTVQVTTRYTLTNDNQLRVQFTATTDRTTPVNVAQHTYWNLAGAGAGTILDHRLQLHADRFTPGDPVPTGTIRPVRGTPLDFLAPKAIGKDLQALGGKPVGFDHNFVVQGPAGQLRPVARLSDPTSGRVLTLESDQPGLQFYSGNFLDGTVQGKGGVYRQYAGLCLETQKFPNAINIPDWKDQVVLRPGQTYQHTMVFRFSTE